MTARFPPRQIRRLIVLLAVMLAIATTAGAGGTGQDDRNGASTAVVAVHASDTKAATEMLSGRDGDWIAFNGSTQGCDGRVNAIAVGADGRIAVGGVFTICGGAPANNVAIFDPAMNHWSAAGGGVTSTSLAGAAIHGLAWFRGTLFAAGEFTHAGGEAAADLARWDGDTWSGVGLSGVGTTTYAVAVSDEYLYAAGNFQSIGGVNARGVARWDGAAWSALGTGVSSAEALLVAGSTLYVGGSFSSAGGQPANRVAAWAGGAWSSLGGGLPISSDRIGAMVMYRGDLHVGGLIRRLPGDVPVRNIARWDGQAWSALAGNGTNGVNAPVRDLAVHGDHLVVAGYFTSVVGVPAQSLAKWDGSTWSTFDSEVGSGGVEALAVAGARLYAGGFFRYAGAAPADRIAGFENGAWRAVGSSRQRVRGVNGPVFSLASFDGAMILGGRVTQAGPIPSAALARLDDFGWSEFGFGCGPGPSQSVAALVSDGTDLYAGGAFYQAGATVANKVARWDGATWHALGGGVGLPGSLNDSVFALAMFQGNLYAGGSFAWVEGQPAGNLARWDGNSWTPLFAGVFNDSQLVFALAATDEYLYVGGQFPSVGGIPARNIARFDGTNWSVLDGGSLDGVGGGVAAILPVGNDVFVAGGFNEAGGSAIGRIARWDGTGWHALGSGLGADLGAPAFASALAWRDGVLYVGGSFQSADGVVANNLARWRPGHGWRSLGIGAANGVDGTVAALAFAGETLHVGGAFLHAGGQLSTWYAQWQLPVFGDGFEDSSPVNTRRP